MPVLEHCRVDGLILAGGKSRRMGQDKANLQVAGKTLLQYQIDTVRPEVVRLFVAGNGQANTQLDAGIIGDVTTIGDFLPDSEGPLSGALAALQASSAVYLWIMPCDCFGLTASLKTLLLTALQDSGADIAYITHEGSSQPLLAMWRTAVRPDLLHFLLAGERSVLRWYASMNAIAVPCVLEKGQYCNLNTPDDFQALLDALC